jgi:hypothetical protein
MTQDIQYFVETGSWKSPWGTQLTPPIATESEAIAAAHRQHEIDRTHDHRQPLSVVARWEENGKPQAHWDAHPKGGRVAMQYPADALPNPPISSHRPAWRDEL